MPPETEQVPVQHRSYTKLFSILGVMLVLLLAVGGWQLYVNSGNSQKASHADFYKSLSETNTSFAQAEQLAAQDRYSDALTLYREALQSTRDDEQRLQIRLLEARTLVLMGSYMEAVPILKEIAGTQSELSTSRARALAFAEIAAIYSFGRVQVNREIFKDEPFKSLWVANDIDLTLRRLYEYAASIHPIAIAQLRVAQSYAAELSLEGDTLSDLEVQTKIAAIQGLLSSADQDIEYLRGQSAMTKDLHTALLARAKLIGDVQIHGVSLGDADEAFATAIAAYASEGPGHDGVARYYYAIFLAQAFGESRASDIQEILAPLSTAAYAQSSVTNTLKTARTNGFFRQFPVLLSSIDPEFKAYLVTLGWTQANFTL
jgi:hypothetical protein